MHWTATGNTCPEPVHRDPKTVLRLLATAPRRTKLATLQCDLVFARKYFRMLRSLIRKNRGLIALEFSSVIASVDLKKLVRAVRMCSALTRFFLTCHSHVLSSGRTQNLFGLSHHALASLAFPMMSCL